MPIARKLSIAEYSEMIMDSMGPIACIIGEIDMYQYNGSYYELLTTVEIGQIIYNYFLRENIICMWTLSLEAGIIKAMRYHPTKIDNITEFDVNTRYINVTNGLIDLESTYPYDLVEHDPKIYYLTKVDVVYNPEINDSSNFMKFLNSSITLPTMEPDTQTIEFLMMMCGYIIYPQNPIEGIFVFLGGGANGKSLFIDIIKTFFPKEFLSTLSLRELSLDSMEKDQLLTSRLNICS